jgi:hypothetical protein
VVRGSFLLLMLSSYAGACADPVREQAIAALGPEEDGVPPGPLHRPGQPCLLCHDSLGDHGPRFSVAGTVYARADGRVSLNKVTVHLIDSSGQKFDALTNCAGNFYVSPSELTVQYPLWVTLAVGDKTLDMESPSFREGSCAACHSQPKGSASAGQVYFLLDEDPDLSASHYCK